MDPSPRPDLAAPGLYVHVPFCSAICPYCDFYVLTGDRAGHERYVERVLAEASLWSDRWTEARPFDTLYLGGGTPSAIAPDLLARLVEGLRERLPIAPGAWLSLEANPEDVGADRPAAWRALGVRTLSLGVQSFDDRRLAWLGRRHDGVGARQAVERAVAAGFATVSLDLIFGLPDQTPAEWERELATALAAGIDHLSAYQLTIHQGTPFGFRQARGRLVELPEDGQAELFLLAHRRLAAAGWEGYEVSNFAATPAHRSVHNRKYWRHTPYLGLGPSAHSFAADRRWWNVRKMPWWAERIDRGELPVDAEETLSARDLATEMLMLRLRTCDGVPFAEARDRYGLDLRRDHGATLRRLQEAGLWRVEPDRLAPTTEGLAVADALVRALL